MTMSLAPSAGPGPAEAFVEALPFPAVWIDEQRTVRRLNRHAWRLLGLTPVAPDTPWDEICEGADLAWIEAELNRFASIPELEYSFERELSVPGGSVWVNVFVKRFPASAGARGPAGVFLIDVTAQKRLATALASAHKELEQRVETRTAELAWANESLRQYLAERERTAAQLRILSSAVEQTADHVIITDRAGLIEYVNPSFERRTGWSLREAVGKTPRLVKSGRMDPALFTTLWATIVRGEPFRAKFINRAKNGELYYEDKTITPIKDDHDRIVHFVSVGRDVTPF
jgi:PAS domain S-box-containing protein